MLKNIDPEYNKSDANIFGHVVDKKDQRAHTIYQYCYKRHNHWNNDRRFRALPFEKFTGRRIYIGG